MPHQYHLYFWFWCYVSYLLFVFPWGKTVNSYRRNRDIIGMLPIPPKAVERGLAPPDLFPHKSIAKIPVLRNGVSHQKQTPYPPKHENPHHEFKAHLFLWSMAMLSEIGDTPKWTWELCEGVHIQYICAVVVAAGALHRPYDHRIGLWLGATICQFIITK